MAGILGGQCPPTSESGGASAPPAPPVPPPMHMGAGYRMDHTDVFKCFYGQDGEVSIDKAAPGASGSNVY